MFTFVAITFVVVVVVDIKRGFGRVEVGVFIAGEGRVPPSPPRHYCGKKRQQMWEGGESRQAQQRHGTEWRNTGSERGQHTINQRLVLVVCTPVTSHLHQFSYQDLWEDIRRKTYRKQQQMWLVDLSAFHQTIRTLSRKHHYYGNNPPWFPCKFVTSSDRLMLWFCIKQAESIWYLRGGKQTSAVVQQCFRDGSGVKPVTLHVCAYTKCIQRFQYTQKLYDGLFSQSWSKTYRAISLPAEQENLIA